MYLYINVFLPFSESKNKFNEIGTKKENIKINNCFLILSGSFNITSIPGIKIDNKIQQI